MRKVIAVVLACVLLFAGQALGRTVYLSLSDEDSPAFAGLDLTGLTDDYVPYVGADGLADSPISTDGSDVAINSLTASRLVASDGSKNLTSTITEANLEASVSDMANIIQAAEIDTSAKLAGIVGDETGSGALVFGTSPTLSDLDLSDITDGYVPYVTAGGMADSPIYTDGTNVGIGTTGLGGKLTISSDASSLNQFIRLENTESGHERNWMLGILNASSGAFRIYDLTADTTRFLIDSSGKVGIGTTSPDANLEVEESAASEGRTLLEIDGDINSGAAVTNIYGVKVVTSVSDYAGGTDVTNMYGVYVDDSSSGAGTTLGNYWGIYVPAAGTRVGNAYGAYFADNVGINTNTPATKLAVNGLTSTSSYNLVRVDTADGDFYYDSSSERNKENILEYSPSLTKVLALTPVAYTDSTSGQQEIGLVAEDLNEIDLNDLVIYNSEGEPDGIKYERLNLFLLQALREMLWASLDTTRKQAIRNQVRKQWLRQWRRDNATETEITEAQAYEETGETEEQEAWEVLPREQWAEAIEDRIVEVEDRENITGYEVETTIAEDGTVTETQKPIYGKKQVIRGKKLKGGYRRIKGRKAADGTWIERPRIEKRVTTQVPKKRIKQRVIERDGKFYLRTLPTLEEAQAALQAAGEAWKPQWLANLN